ncbi:beta-lactamase family protein [Exilibacterium tricleocarpae]|uniref:Beta-lactamase family protein n=1 Tax=Exilibacterium tricleocarpae TaxID=2591008 RepID=A0A545TBE3_9GAMM|nr:serine hydrolase domain-containing protein [Exilibacterium tricleocarpae]TQV74543.1 beta-lactamase family protein [Exilibacterium tricleocarpae]
MNAQKRTLFSQDSEVGQKFLTKIGAALITAVSLLSSPAGAADAKSKDLLTEKKLAALAPTFESYVTSGKLAGIATLVAHKGQIVHSQTIGKRDLGTGAPMTMDTIFRIYSMTKPITSTAIMILVERGKLDLDDPLEKFIPEFSDPMVFVSETEEGVVTVPAEKSITIKDLLTHTSGLTYGIAGQTSVHKQYPSFSKDLHVSSIEDVSKKIAEIPLVAQPGTSYNYSVSIAVLGRVIEVVSGEPLNEFIANHISTPLGMHDTDFYVPKEKLGRYADNYTVGEGGSLVLIDDNEKGIASGKLPKLFIGGGGMASSIIDYYRFCQMILNKGELDGMRILKESTVELMTKSHLPSDFPNITYGTTELKGVGFGYGFAVVEDPAPTSSPGSAGELWWGGYASTSFWIDPKEKIAAVLMTQRVPSSPVNSIAMEMRRKFQNIVYDALKL